MAQPASPSFLFCFVFSCFCDRMPEKERKKKKREQKEKRGITVPQSRKGVRSFYLNNPKEAV